MRCKTLLQIFNDTINGSGLEKISYETLKEAFESAYVFMALRFSMTMNVNVVASAGREDSEKEQLRQGQVRRCEELYREVAGILGWD